MMNQHKQNAVFLSKEARDSFIRNGASKTRSRSVQPAIKAGISLLNELAPQEHSEIFLDQLKSEDIEALQEFEVIFLWIQGLEQILVGSSTWARTLSS